MNNDGWTTTDDSANVFLSRSPSGSVRLSISTPGGTQCATLGESDQQRLAGFFSIQLERRITS